MGFCQVDGVDRMDGVHGMDQRGQWSHFSANPKTYFDCRTGIGVVTYVKADSAAIS